MKRSGATRACMCVLVSGGLDSALLLYRLQKAPMRLFPVYVRTGLRWESAELYWLPRFLKAARLSGLFPLRVVDLPIGSLYGRHWSLENSRRRRSSEGGHNRRGVPGARSLESSVYLPGRNILLLSAAAIVCAKERISDIALGVLKGNPFGDATPAFFRGFAVCLTNALGRPIHIKAPLARLRKIDLIRVAEAVPLGLTFSCLQPKGIYSCGRCNKCAERKRVFRAAGAADPTRYV